MKLGQTIVKDKNLYDDFFLKNPWCMACGINEGDARFYCWPGLSRHHICKFRRDDSWCNLLVLCRVCHDRAEGLLKPKLSVRSCLMLKKVRDGGNFDLARCVELLGWKAVELEPVPDICERAYRMRRPWDEGRFCKEGGERAER